MTVKATTNFSGTVSMAKGEERELPAGSVLNDLLSCGYIVPVDKEEKSEAKRGNKRKD